jgi:hypothetical protein
MAESLHLLGDPAPPAAGPSAPARRLPHHLPKAADAGVEWWLVGAHGGAGVSTLIRAGASASDSGTAWPVPADQFTAGVVVVARGSAYGLEWARDVARQHAAGAAPAGVRLLGLAVVADAPGRRPAALRRLLTLVSGGYPRTWPVDWVEQWRQSGHSDPLTVPRSVRSTLRRMQAVAGTHPVLPDPEEGPHDI